MEIVNTGYQSGLLEVELSKTETDFFEETIDLAYILYEDDSFFTVPISEISQRLPKYLLC